MQTATTLEVLRSAVDLLRGKGKRLALVPTMGALHEGHLTLVREARKHADAVAVSIFVNPKQFNNPDDLKKYPRSEEADAALLATVPVDAIFALENGVTASLHMDFLQRAVTRKIKIVSTMGNLVWNIVEDTVELVAGTGSVQLFTPPHRDRNHSYREEMNEFISKGRCGASVEDALSVMQLVTAGTRQRPR